MKTFSINFELEIEYDWRNSLVADYYISTRTIHNCNYRLHLCQSSINSLFSIYNAKFIQITVYDEPLAGAIHCKIWCMKYQSPILWAYGNISRILLTPKQEEIIRNVLEANGLDPESFYVRIVPIDYLVT